MIRVADTIRVTETIRVTDMIRTAHCCDADGPHPPPHVAATGPRYVSGSLPCRVAAVARARASRRPGCGRGPDGPGRSPANWARAAGGPSRTAAGPVTTQLLQGPWLRCRISGIPGRGIGVRVTSHCDCAGSRSQ